MVVVPWRCYKELSSFAKEMNQLFDRFFGHDRIDLPSGKSLFPVVTIADTADEVFVTMEAHGYAPEEISITLRQNTLTIRGQREHDEGSDDRESSYSPKEAMTFVRSISLREEIDPGGIQATFKNATLIIRLPKLKVKPVFIKITVE